MARAMTAAEKSRFAGYFPNLDVNAAIVTDEISSVYNCISWTVGITNRWIWPGNTLVNFDTFYQGFGFVQAGDGPISAWGNSTLNMTHGAVSGSGHGPRWESKCGNDLRIQHGLSELVGSLYGRVIAFYRRGRALTPTNESIVEEVMKEKTVKSYMSNAQKKAIAGERESLSSDLRERYRIAFDAWKSSWFRGSLSINSNPISRTVGPEYDALITMGSGIIPLVIESLADPENFFALQLYDAIQSNEQLLVQFGPEDERILEGEQGRAKRVVQAWFANR